MTTTVDELRTAAAALRALATAASTDPDGTLTAHWHTEPRHPDDDTLGHHLYGDHLTRDDGRTISWPLLNRGGSPQRPAYMHAQHAAYAAAMGPNVGTLLADWLDAMAVWAAAYPEMAHDHERPACEDYACDVMGRGIALARQINATARTAT